MKLALNLGCGVKPFKSTPEIEWQNIDILPGTGVDLVLDWQHLEEHWSGQPIDLIVAEHSYEHVNCGMQPIKQCYGVLKDGGSLIVSVPDLRKLAYLWLRGELSTQIYLTSIYGPFDGTDGSMHRWGFDREYLMEQLRREAPWSRVIDFDYRAIPGADIANDERWILCLEAIK